jgi:hypothetical protein
MATRMSTKQCDGSNHTERFSSGIHIKLNAKVKLSVCFLTGHHAIKAYWGAEVLLYAFSTSALDGGEWSASRPGRFTPRERVPGTHWKGGWEGPRAGLDTVMKRNSYQIEK